MLAYESFAPVQGLIHSFQMVFLTMLCACRVSVGYRPARQKFSIIQTLLPLVMPWIASSRPFGAAIAQVRHAPRWSQSGVAWPSKSTRSRVALVGD
jgi:hypothetical protein